MSDESPAILFVICAMAAIGLVSCGKTQATEVVAYVFLAIAAISAAVVLWIATRPRKDRAEPDRRKDE